MQGDNMFEIMVEETHLSFESLIDVDSASTVVDKERQRSVFLWFQAVGQHVLLVVVGANSGHDTSYWLVFRKHPVPIKPHYGRCVFANLTPCNQTIYRVKSLDISFFLEF